MTDRPATNFCAVAPNICQLSARYTTCFVSPFWCLQ